VKYNKRIDALIKYQMPLKFSDQKNFLNCDLNESLFPIPESILGLRLEAEDISRYPRNRLPLITHEIGKYNQVSEKNILVYNGSDSALAAIFEGFCDGETRVLTFAPDYTQVETFIRLKTHKIHKLIDPAPLSNESISEANFDDIDLVYFSNPCNPTGKVIEHAMILNWIAKNPRTLFIVDEAYFEFYGKSLAGQVSCYENLIVTRTFSKAFGLAGLRLGYVIASEKIISILDKFRNEKNVTNLAIQAGLISLNELASLERNLSELELSRKTFYDHLDPRILAPKSYANFVLIKCRDSEIVMKELQKQEIMARDRSMLTNLENCIRITLGPKLVVEKILSIVNQHAV
jgi:histidinol-phosphate aminotransferase